METIGKSAAAYDVERKYLSQISAAELVARILRSHINRVDEKQPSGAKERD